MTPLGAHGGSGSATTALVRGFAAPPGMTVLDWVIVVLYGLGMLAIGWYFSRRSTTNEDYLLGGRNMRSGPIGLSLFATLFSTITYLALPGEMIRYGPTILWWMATLPIIYLVVAYLLIPRFMTIRGASGYQILEGRLGVHIRLIGSTMFLLTRILWMALIIDVTVRKVILPATDWSESTAPYVAVVVGLVTLVYTTMGGIRAVVLTDVIQSFILLGGAVAAISVISYNMGGVSTWWPREWVPNWGNYRFFSTDPADSRTIAGSLVFMTMWWICTAGSDQMAIQRYLATRDTRAARRAFLTTVVSNVVITLILAAVGFALLGFFRAHPDYLAEKNLSLEDPQSADKLFPYYIVRFLPPGVTGLVISGLLAAAMSSLSSGINAGASVIRVDFVDRLWRRRPRGVDGFAAQSIAASQPGGAPVPLSTRRSSGRDQDTANLRETKLIALLTGLVGIALSMLMGHIPGNILEVTVRTNHVFVAPLFGLFVMALFVPFATQFGTALGALAGCTAAILVAYWDILAGGPKLSFQWITFVSLLANLIVGCGVSWLQIRTKR
jgi:solute:Na+ symporter, SSS family